MKNIKTLIALMLILVMVLSMAACGKKAETPAATEAPAASEAPVEAAPAGEESAYYKPGDKMEDFTFIDYNGKSYTLSEVLEEKDAVLLNIWATYCGPCGMEFPYMEEAYQMYKDRVEIFAMSAIQEDSAEIIKEYAAARGLSFPMGCLMEEVVGRFEPNGIPTSILIDRFGNIAFIDTGALPSTTSFVALFEAVLGDDYTETVTYEGLPPMKPTVEALSSEEISKVLNIEGQELVFSTPEDTFCWPMQITEKDGKTVLVSSNVGYDSSYSAVETMISAKAGDVVKVSFKVSSEGVLDNINFLVDDEQVAFYSGERDWLTYAYQFENDGEYKFTIQYSKDMYYRGGEDCAWIEKVELLSGDEAKDALDANAEYVYGEKTELTILNENAEEIVLYAPGIPEAGSLKACIVNEPEARFFLSIDESENPEGVLICYDVNNFYCAPQFMTDKGYEFSFAATPGEDSLLPFGLVQLYDSAEEGVEQFALCETEEVAQNLLEMLFTDENTGEVIGTWVPADEYVPEEAGEDVSTVSGDAEYTVKCIDQNGDPVANVMVQVCDDNTCSVFTSDANGICSFTMAPQPYGVHILMAPEGYENDGSTQVTNPQGGELTFVLNKK